MKIIIKSTLITLTVISLVASMYTLVAFGKTDRKQAIVIGNTCTDIQRTINDSATGTTVYINGTYSCDVGLIFGKTMKLIGTKGTRLVAQDNIGGIVYDYKSVGAKIEIAGIIFDVNKRSKVIGIAFGAGNNLYLRDYEITNCLDIWCQNTGNVGAMSQLLMERVTISSSTNGTFESVLVMNTKNCLIRNNTFTNLTQGPAALALYVGSTNCIVQNNNYASNTIRDFYSSGVDSYIYDSNNTTGASSSEITARGVQIFNTRRAIFSNNTINGQNNGSSASGGFIIYDYGVGLDGHNTGLWATSSEIFIVNNTINKSYSGISIPCMYGDDKHYEKRSIHIVGNTIIDPLWKAVDIGCPGQEMSMKNIQVMNNIVKGVTKVFEGGNFSITGATSTSAVNIKIKGNTGLRSSAGGNSSCVYVTGASNVTIEDNNCAGVGKGAFSDIQVDASSTSNVIIR